MKLKFNMFEKTRPKNWKDSYWNQINRNIGFITFSEQESLRISSIAIFGVGGLGGPLAIQLIRAGCENLTICDNEKFQESNLNRQMCTRNDIGKYKVDILENYLEKINPDINISKYYEISNHNISEILNNIKIAALTLDDPICSILICRECAKRKIPIVESWGVPFLCAWWFTKESVDYETCYELKTKQMSIEQIEVSENIQLDVRNAILSKVFLFPGLEEICDRESGAVEGMLSGNLPLRSFAPMIRMTASYLAYEIIFSGILKIRKKTLAPRVNGYDYIRMKKIEFSFI